MDLNKVRTGADLQPACETKIGAFDITETVLICIFNTLQAVECGQEIHCFLHSPWCENVALGNYTLPEQEQEQVNSEVDLVK